MELPDFLVEQEYKNPNIRVFRDEEIRTTWKYSKTAKRIYRDVDCLVDVADMKPSEDLNESDAINFLIERAKKYRDRVIKKGGWSTKSCYGDTYWSPLKK